MHIGKNNVILNNKIIDIFNIECIDKILNNEIVKLQKK